MWERKEPGSGVGSIYTDTVGFSSDVYHIHRMDVGAHCGVFNVEYYAQRSCGRRSGKKVWCGEKGEVYACDHRLQDQLQHPSDTGITHRRRLVFSLANKDAATAFPSIRAYCSSFIPLYAFFFPPLFPPLFFFFLVSTCTAPAISI